MYVYKPNSRHFHSPDTMVTKRNMHWSNSDCSVDILKGNVVKMSNVLCHFVCKFNNICINAVTEYIAHTIYVHGRELIHLFVLASKQNRRGDQRLIFSSGV